MAIDIDRRESEWIEGELIDNKEMKMTLAEG